MRDNKESLYAVLRLLSITFVTCANKGRFSNKGTEFIFGFMPNEPDSLVTLRLSITTQVEKYVSVTITTPLFDPSYQTSISVRSGQVKDVVLSSALQGSSGVENKGIYIKADGDVSVYASNTRHESMDDFLVLPTMVLGNEYYVMSWSSYKSFFMIVATENFTKLTITLGRSSQSLSLMGNTIGAGESVIVNMRKFETFFVQTPDRDLTGTHILGNTTFAVFGGNVCGKVHHSTCGHMAEQMLPIDKWGTEFVTLRIPGCGSADWYKIVAAFNNTIVIISGMPAKTLVQSGDFYSFTLVNSSFKGVFSDKPISLFMFSSGFCGTTYGYDPPMLMIPPLSQYSSSVTFSTNSSDKINFENYVSIVIDATFTDGLRYDGSELPSVSWFSVSGLPGVVYTEFKVSTDVHSITHLNCSVKFLAFAAGIQNNIAYSYLLGIEFLSNNETYGFHLLHHLSHFVKLYGPPDNFWMFPYERFNHTLTTSVSSHSHPEVSSIEKIEVQRLLAMLEAANIVPSKTNCKEEDGVRQGTYKVVTRPSTEPEQRLLVPLLKTSIPIMDIYHYACVSDTIIKDSTIEEPKHRQSTSVVFSGNDVCRVAYFTKFININSSCAVAFMVTMVYHRYVTTVLHDTKEGRF